MILSRRIKSWVYKVFMSGPVNQLRNTIIKELDRQASRQSFDNLWDKTLHCKESGITNDHYCEEEVVVSLTSYGDRIHSVHLAIESIMRQTVKPNRIVLWLSEEEFKGKTLPIALQMQQKRGLTIAYCEDLKSYKKLIPSLTLFPEACIITIDDDIAYYPDFLERLINTHKESPSDICALRMHEMKIRDNGNILPYNNWRLCIEKCPEENRLAFFTTGGGVLFPPHSLSDEVFNKDVYMSECATADDVWFNAMRILNGVKVTRVFSENPKGDYTELPSSNTDPLKGKNMNQGGNDKAVAAVFGRYDLLNRKSL